MPEYTKARSACEHGQFKNAAETLAQLEKSPRLTEDERAFVRTQEQICLRHLSPRATAPTPAIQNPHTGLTAKSAIQNSTDCGPRALLIACEKLGMRTNLAALTKAAVTGPRGTTLQGLKRAAESVGLKAEGVQVSREALPDQPLPSICWFHGDHYACLLALTGRGESGTALIHDPNDPVPIVVSLEDLLQSSSGVLLTLRR
jgi:hypothetical protein